MKNQKGFTLIEMIVVLAILSILAAATYPRISGYIETRREQYRLNQEYLINKTLMQYYALTGKYISITCGESGVINSTDSDIMLDELKKKTGAMISNESGDQYQYKNLYSAGAGMAEEIRKIKVELIP